MDGIQILLQQRIKTSNLSIDKIEVCSVVKKFTVIGTHLHVIGIHT